MLCFGFPVRKPSRLRNVLLFLEREVVVGICPTCILVSVCIINQMMWLLLFVYLADCELYSWERKTYETNLFLLLHFCKQGYTWLWEFHLYKGVWRWFIQEISKLIKNYCEVLYTVLVTTTLYTKYELTLVMLRFLCIVHVDELEKMLHNCCKLSSRHFSITLVLGMWTPTCSVMMLRSMSCVI
jgi:hypothetical protein